MKEHAGKSKKNVENDDKLSVEMTLQDINMTQVVGTIAEREALVQRALALAGQFHGPVDLAEEHDKYVIAAYEA